MTTDATVLEPDEASRLNARQGNPGVDDDMDDIVSVNKKRGNDNKVAKGLFFLVVGAMLVGVLAWFSQDWLNARKAKMRAETGPHAAEDTTQLFNPEKTGEAPPKLRLGADSGVAPPSQAPPGTAVRPGGSRDDGIRALRGSDGKVMVNPQGRAMGVDKDGNIVEVPAITALSGETTVGRKPLPSETSGQSQGQAQGTGGTAAQGQPPKPPSRYGGSLFVAEPIKPSSASNATANSAAASDPNASVAQLMQMAELLRGPGAASGQGARPSLSGANPSEPPRPGTIGSALYSSSTPVSHAKLMSDQNLILPKGRQADCILTGRIVDEVPGFTSCVLAQNLYSDNGRVLLLERGSELSGEYGVTNQLGLERLFVTWNRLKTPEGVEVDLSSPGSDRLGTSGLPGHLDNRWGARIGAALLLSFVKDITVAVIANQTQRQNQGGTSVTVGGTPGLNTMNASSALAEEVIKQTLKVRPRMTINEGDRVSIYVARDLDFSPVYALKTVGAGGATRLLAP